MLVPTAHVVVFLPNRFSYEDKYLDAQELQEFFQEEEHVRNLIVRNVLLHKRPFHSCRFICVHNRGQKLFHLL